MNSWTLVPTGSAVAMIGANLRFGSTVSNASSNVTKVFQCHPGGTAEAALIFALGTLGMMANVALMAVILVNRQLRRWVHQRVANALSVFLSIFHLCRFQLPLRYNCPTIHYIFFSTCVTWTLLMSLNSLPIKFLCTLLSLVIGIYFSFQYSDTLLSPIFQAVFFDNQQLFLLNNKTRTTNFSVSSLSPSVECSVNLL